MLNLHKKTLNCYPCRRTRLFFVSCHSTPSQCPCAWGPKRQPLSDPFSHRFWKVHHWKWTLSKAFSKKAWGISVRRTGLLDPKGSQQFCALENPVCRLPHAHHRNTAALSTFSCREKCTILSTLILLGFIFFWWFLGQKHTASLCESALFLWMVKKVWHGLHLMRTALSYLRTYPSPSWGHTSEPSA